MRISVRAGLSFAVLMAVAASARAQPAPAPAPRQPVQKDAPVVPPHGPVHAQPPASAHPQAAAQAHSPAQARSKPGDTKHAAGKAATAKPGAALPAQPVPTATPPVATPVPAPPEKLPDPEKPEGAPAKLPRFASLRSDEVNMRSGPGSRYRIEWVYKRRDLPVEIEREFDVWRYVRDADGVQGWMQQATLMGRRSFIIQKAEATIRAEPNDTAPAVAVLKPGVIGRIRSCAAGSSWCNVQTGSYRGWLRREQFWGTLPNEAIAP